MGQARSNVSRGGEGVMRFGEAKYPIAVQFLICLLLLFLPHLQQRSQRLFI